MIKQCQRCGADFETMALNAKWCPTCRKLRKAEYQRCYYRQNRTALCAYAKQYYDEHREQCLKQKNDTKTSTVNNGFCGLSFGVWHTRTTKSNGVQPTPINLKQTARETLNAVGTGGKSNAKKQNSARNCKPLPQNVKPNSNGNRNIIGIHLQCSTASAFRFRHA